MQGLSAIASPLLPTPVSHYDTEVVSESLRYKAGRDITLHVTLQRQEITFEKDNLTDLQQILGDKIHHTQQTDWICFYSPKNMQTWWFLSDKMMQHGEVSGVEISKSRYSQYCNEINKPLPLMFSAPGLGTQRNMVLRYFNLPANITSQVSLYREHEQDNNTSRLNSLQYFFDGNVVTEIIFSRVTTM